MNVYIQTDLEGIAGFTSFEDVDTQTLENYEHRKRMYKLLTAEVNAAVKAAKTCGAQRICVNDSHGTGYNILFEELEEECEINHGRSSHYPTWLPVLGEGFDALVLIGMHAMGEELDGICPHSKWIVNDGELYLSEASMAMALAGDLNIPTVFVSGDQVIIGEVRNKLPQIEFAIVKQAYGPFCCRSIQPKRAQKMIFEGVKRGLTKLDEMKPYKLIGPVTLNLLDNEGFIPPFKPVLKQPVTGATVTEAFNKAVQKFPWNKFGIKIMDYYRYPSNLSGVKQQ